MVTRLAWMAHRLIGVLEETHEIRLCRLLQSKDRMALETQVTLHMCIYIYSHACMKLHSDITNASKEKKKQGRKIADRAHVVVIKLATIPCEAGRSP